MNIFFSILFAYIIGSIPFAIIVVYFCHLPDIRKIGSGNIGATNVLRTGNKLAAFLTLALDIGKAIFALYIIAAMHGYLYLAAVALFLGHVFPIWLKGKGGKGVAVYFALTLGLDLLLAIIFAICWLLVAFIWRYSSMASLAATFIVPIVAIGGGQIDKAMLFFILSIFCWFLHRQNIRRLLKKTESKIKF